jgi:alpha/beta superfamily hydrolase
MNYFLSGWAILPQNLLNCEIIDSTKIVSEYKTIENIAQNFDEIFPKNIEILSAWSMGAIIASGVLEKIKAKKIILCSPALKFVENGDVLEELKKLRENIIQNKETAIKLFARKCGISRDLINTNYYTVKELLAGLDFLENTEIKLAQVSKNSEITVIYGENDKIISPKLSIEVAEKLGVKAIMVDGGGHFFNTGFSK